MLLLKFFLDQTAVAVFADAALKNRMQSQLSQTQGKKRRSASHKGLHGIHHILLSGSRQFLHPGNYQVNVHISKYICVPPLHCLLFISLFPRPLISLSSYLCLLIFVFLYFPFSVCPGCPKRLSPVHTCRSFSHRQPIVFSPAAILPAAHRLSLLQSTTACDNCRLLTDLMDSPGSSRVCHFSDFRSRTVPGTQALRVPAADGLSGIPIISSV